MCPANSSDAANNGRNCTVVSCGQIRQDPEGGTWKQLTGYYSATIVNFTGGMDSNGDWTTTQGEGDVPIWSPIPDPTTLLAGNSWGPAQAQQVMLQQMQPGGSLFKYYFTQALHIQPPKGFCDTYKDAVRFDKDAAGVGTLVTGAELVTGQPELALFTAKATLVAGGSAAVTDLIGWGYCGK